MTALPAAWPEDLLDHRRRPATARLVTADGHSRRIEPHRWHAAASASDRAVLERASSPVLDVGCGPGRHVAELLAAGLDAMGVDCSTAAVRETRRRGGRAWQASVFEPVPRAGEWATILLLDGNIGIGGDPVRLLARCGELLIRRGRVLVEIEEPGVDSRRGRFRVAATTGDAAPGDDRDALGTESANISWLGDWFSWATVPVNQIEHVAAAAGFDVLDVWSVEDRWFAELVSVTEKAQ